MKKIARILSLLLALAAAFTLASCKKNKPNGEDGFEWNPYPYEDLGVYLTLADYKSLSVSQSLIDKEMNLFLDGIFNENGLYISVTDGSAVKEWDRVKIVFSSIVIDGTTVYPEQKDEGAEGSETAENTEAESSSESEENTESSATFTVGSEEMISELENAVIGMTLNSEKEVTFTVPDEYKELSSYAPYVGKTATFKFQLTEHKAPPKVTDDLIYRYTSMKYSTVDIMHEALQPQIIYDEIWDSIVEGSVLISCPEKEYNEYRNTVLDDIDLYAKSNGKTREQYVTGGGQSSYLSLYDGITMEEFYTLLDEYVKSNIKIDLVLHSLIRAEGLTPSGSLYTAAEKEYILSYGIGYTIEMLEEQYGKERITTCVMEVQVRRKILQYVKIDA